ncbi:NAD-dependent epimerase/dehydratase family protein [Luteimonas terrae]|nr:NAD-dependent epimerase/dehydratase family protein [Luteimonas terrae]
MKAPLVIVGATGMVGTRLVAQALAAGRRTIAIANDADALDRLQARYGAALTTLFADIRSDGDAADLAARLRALPGPAPGAVIAAIRGAAGSQRVLDAPADFLRRRLDEDLLPHLSIARHLLPMLATQPRAGYVLIGGPGADHPWSGYGHHSIGASALRMLARVLHEEARTLPVRVQMLAVDSPVRCDANAATARAQWPDVDAIADHALRLVDGAANADVALVRFPIGAAVRPPGLSDDLDVGPCAPPTQHQTDASALLRRLATAASPQESRS